MRIAIVAICCSVVLTGCGKTLRIPAYTIPATDGADGTFRFGRGKADITPPPGYSMGGHSLEGAVARGYWTRLYARAFYFQDAGGRKLVLVSCDTFAIPAGLTAKVLTLVNSSIALPAQSLVLHATHTHQGAGNYMTSPVYNGFSGALPGFSPEMFNFLAERISEAVRSAARDAEDSVSSKHQLILRREYAPNLQRNRAVGAFLNNPAHDQQFIMNESELHGQLCRDASGKCVRYHAVDPSLTLLDVQRTVGGGFQSVAVLAFYAVHPTALSHEASLYNSDFSGVAMILLEQRGAKQDLVAGYFNGAEGDLSLQWVRRDRPEVMELGTRLADHIDKLRAGPPMVDSTPDKNFTICAAQEQFAAYPAVGPTTGLAPPQFGAATMGGAEDGRSAFFYSLWHGGVKGNSGNSQQVPKIGALELPQLPWYIRKFARLVTNPGAFPHSLPVTVARLGDLVSIVAVPFEVTTLAGSRLRSRLLPSQRSRAVLLVGLANEYLSYLATPEEYLAQEYEGASTVFGRSQATVVEHLVSIVANRLQSCAAPDPQPVTVPATKYPLGIPPIIPLGPQLFDQRRNLVEEGLEPFIPDSTGRLRFDYPRFEWDESSIPDFTAQDREVTIYESTGAGWRPVCVNGVREDDAGLNLLTVLTEARGSLRNWSAIWLFPHRPHSDGQYFFRVRTAKQEDQCSKPFYLPSPSGYPASPLAPAACPEPMPDTCSN